MTKRSPHARELHRPRFQPRTVPDKRRDELERIAEEETEHALRDESASGDPPPEARTEPPVGR